MAKKVLTPEEIEAKQAKQVKINACATMEELQAVGAELGYKEGWAAHAWPFHPQNPVNQTTLTQEEDIDADTTL